jgi:3-isopropylmalate/(R)-2-methylmalate dehydratase small subunit
VAIDAASHASLLAQLARAPESEVTIDLAALTLRLPDGTAVKFPIDPFSRTCLLEGVDELGYILRFEPRIAEHERSVREGA